MDGSASSTVLISLMAMCLAFCSGPSPDTTVPQYTIQRTDIPNEVISAKKKNPEPSGALATATSDSSEWKSGARYQYLELRPARATHVARGKIEVVEFFWYSCPHCFALEPYLAKWAREQREKVEFVRVPIAWDDARRSDARLFYALKALGREDLHQNVFDTIHVLGNPLRGPKEEETLALRVKFAESCGISADDFKRAYTSEAVTHEVDNAAQVAKEYEVLHVPVVIIGGKYETDLRVGGQSALVAVLSKIVATQFAINLPGPYETGVRVGDETPGATTSTAMKR